MVDMYKSLRKRKNYKFINLKNKKAIIESFILIFSVITINFAGYIIYFNVNIVYIIDTVTIIKYILITTIIFAISLNLTKTSFNIRYDLDKLVSSQSFSDKFNMIILYISVVIVFLAGYLSLLNEFLFIISNLIIILCMYYVNVLVNKKILNRLRIILYLIKKINFILKTFLLKSYQFL